MRALEKKGKGINIFVSNCGILLKAETSWQKASSGTRRKEIGGNA